MMAIRRGETKHNATTARTLVMLILVSSLLSVLLVVFSSSGAAAQEDPVCPDGSTTVDGTCRTLADAEKNKKVFNPIGNFLDNAGKFLEENVFTLDDEENGGNNDNNELFSALESGKTQAKEEASNTAESLLNLLNNISGGSKNKVKETASSAEDATFQALMETVQRVTKDGNTRNFQDTLQLFSNTWKRVQDQLRSHFVDHNLLRNTQTLNPIAFWYAVEHTDEVMNPSWKRRQHRFDAPVSQAMVMELHHALYLSELAYVDTVDEITKGLATITNHTWQLVYASVESMPGEPAHFMAIPKGSKQHAASVTKKMEMEKKKDKAPLIQMLEKATANLHHEDSSYYLEVLLVVRGTKELGDILSDGLLEASDFMDDYKAHAGVAQSGKFLVESHTSLLEELLFVSGKRKVHLMLVGHSLGAGAASIAAMLFDKEDWIDVTAVGFGCPSLVSLPLSEKFQDKITTVISDADIVPRMSGASLLNMVLNVMSYDWTDKALEDARLMLDHFHVPNANGLLQWMNETMDKIDRPRMASVPTERVKPELYPPGTCVHLFRDGAGISATYKDCSFFGQVELSRTLLDDHLIPTGYHRNMVEFMRGQTNNLNFDFPDKVLELRAYEA